ncbi:MAG: hypothetical protein ACK41D_06925 [Rubricoccaceae bacterium]
MRAAVLALALLACAAPSGAQAPVFTALPVLEIAPSPAQTARGGASTALAPRDPFAFLANPAHLGLAAHAPYATSSGLPGMTDWLNAFRYGSAALAGGVRRGPLALGAGVAQASLRSERRTLADGTPYAPEDRYWALGVGAGTTGAVRVAVGANARYIESTDAPRWDGEAFHVGTLRGASADVGVLAQADVAALAGHPAFGTLRPALEVSAGYAQTHVGGTVRYSGGHAQALPRTASLGWAVSTGLDLPLADAPALRLVRFDATLQADRSLVFAHGDGRTGYAPLTGGALLAKAALGQGDERTTGRRGLRVELAETIALSQGHLDGWGFSDVRTRGVEVSAAGVLKTAAAYSGHEALRRAAGHLDVRLTRATLFAGTPEASHLTGVAVTVRP